MGTFGLYEIIKEQKNSGCLLTTVVEGEHTGEKGLFFNGRLQWQNTNEGILKKYADRLLGETGCHLLKLDEELVFCEEIGGEPVLVICGGGHVSISIIELAKKIGFYVIVLEDRPAFADNAKEGGADEVILDTFENGMEQLAGNKDTYFVIVTRGHRYDRECLRAVLGKEHAYIGMMGSHKRVAMVKQQLEKEGYDRKLLERVHTPIGLDIGAETPEEIAVSVAAELIQIKNQKKKAAGYDRELLRWLSGEKEPEKKKVLATIISRNGSAPRAVGTKMLILEDGRCIGTIGGGSAENEIKNQALFVLRENAISYRICEADMTGQEAEDAGMVCGGTIKVFLEEIK